MRLICGASHSGVAMTCTEGPHPDVLNGTLLQVPDCQYERCHIAIVSDTLGDAFEAGHDRVQLERASIGAMVLKPGKAAKANPAFKYV